MWRFADQVRHDVVNGRHRFTPDTKFNLRFAIFLFRFLLQRLPLLPGFVGSLLFILQFDLRREKIIRKSNN